MENKKIPGIWGTGVLKSALSLEKVAEIVSERLFGGLPFEGKDKHIYEEVPAVFIEAPILGLSITLSAGYENSYILNIKPYVAFDQYLYDNKLPTERLRIDTYLYHLLKQELEDFPEIEIKEE